MSLTDSIEQYVCLSYVWGDASIPVTIWVDERRHAVTGNLHSLLCRLRALECGENLWIDALCIDQSNYTEKAEQVELMGRIYSGAKEVLIGLEERAQYLRQPVGKHALVKAAIEGLAKGLHLYELNCFLPAAAKETDENAYDPFQRLLMSPWFTRTWTIQEVCLARGATLLCSWGTLPWTIFGQAFRSWNDHRRGCCSSFAELLDEDVKTACYRVSFKVLAKEDSRLALNFGC